MHSLSATATASASASASAASLSSPLKLLRRRIPPTLTPTPYKLLCASANPPAGTGNHAGVRLDETVHPSSEKSRLDAWVSSRIAGVSRARIQSSIRSGLATVNGRTIDKVSHIIRGGDKVSCTISELQPLRAEPEDLPLDIVYEDPHVLVVNKAAHMDEHSHAHLSEQFKSRTIHRIYISLTSGVPSPSSGRVEIPIARDSNNRLRMAAITGSNNSGTARYAASRYKVIEVFLGSGSALVEWRLETGRTHQIRVHAKYLGIPLLGDELYGGTKNMALSLLRPKTSPKHHGVLSHLISKLERPYLHALALGFKHPHTGKDLRFSCRPPDDFSEVLGHLRKLSGLTPDDR